MRVISKLPVSWEIVLHINNTCVEILQVAPCASLTGWVRLVSKTIDMYCSCVHSMILSRWATVSVYGLCGRELLARGVYLPGPFVVDHNVIPTVNYCCTLYVYVYYTQVWYICSGSITTAQSSGWLGPFPSGQQRRRRGIKYIRGRPAQRIIYNIQIHIVHMTAMFNFVICIRTRRRTSISSRTCPSSVRRPTTTTRTQQRRHRRNIADESFACPIVLFARVLRTGRALNEYNIQECVVE